MGLFTGSSSPADGVAVARPVVRRTRRRGRSTIEMLVVIGTIALVGTITFVAISRAMTAARSTTCLNNLRQIALALRDYASDNNDFFPDPLASGTPWEATVLPTLKSRAVFKCPADIEVYPVIGSSYDWRDTSQPQTTVVGKSVLSIRSDAVLVFDALPNWHRAASVNVARVDGSAMPMSEKEWSKDLRRPAAVGTPPETSSPPPRRPR